MGSSPLQIGIGHHGVGMEDGTCRAEEIVTIPTRSDAVWKCVGRFLPHGGSVGGGAVFERKQAPCALEGALKELRIERERMSACKSLDQHRSWHLLLGLALPSPRERYRGSAYGLRYPCYMRM